MRYKDSKVLQLKTLLTVHIERLPRMTLPYEFGQYNIGSHY